MRLAIVMAAALAAGAAQPADVTTPAVRLDVLVAGSHGERIEALRPADFRVTIGGNPVDLSSVHFVDTRSSAPIKPADKEESSRLFGIVLDEYHVTAGPAAERIRDALVRFVREDLRPDDRVVVLKPLDPLASIVLGTDHEAAARAIETFRPRLGDYTARTPFEAQFIAGAPAQIDLARAQITTALINALSTQLGTFDVGRTTMIVVSEGFVVRGSRRGENLGPGVSSISLSANRARVALYPIDPATVADDDTRRAGRKMLRSLAAETTGRYADVSVEPRAALRSALADASAYYVIAFERGGERDGRFHDVAVAVSRAGAAVRARRGYWSPPDLERHLSTRFTSPFLAPFSRQLARRTSPAIRAWFGIAPGGNGETRVDFAWEPAPRVPGDRSVLGVPARVELSVTTLDGSPVFEGPVLPAGAWPVAATAPSRIDFGTAAGRLLVQMSIEDADAKVIDHDVRDLVVGGFAGPVTLGTSEVLRTRTGREQQALARDPRATPVVSRSFSRSEQLTVRVPVFWTADPPVVSGRLMSGLGGVMQEMTFTAMALRPGVYQISIPLSGLAAGAYRLEILARGGNGEARDNLAFQVTP